MDKQDEEMTLAESAKKREEGTTKGTEGSKGTTDLGRGQRHDF